MVKKFDFKVIANDEDVTDSLKENLISISFKDEANENADELTIKVAGGFKRPAYKDTLKFSLGDEGKLVFCGTFSVQSSTREKNEILTVIATGVDFSNSLKEKRDISYEQISIKALCSQIASRNQLKVKSNFDNELIQSLAQSGESDLHFLNRIAEDYNAIFNIKNDTLIFTKKIIEDKKNEELPSYTVSSDNCSNITIKQSDRTFYMSCKSVWHDTKDNKTKSILVGQGEPCLVNKGSFKNEAEAKLKTEAKLQKANQGVMSGSLSKDGEVMFAGGTLNVTDTLDDDGEYQIKSVHHTVNGTGWMMNLSFER